MRDIVASVETEYRRYRRLGDQAIAQLDEADCFREVAPQTNSIAALMKHVGGNLLSRFTDFLTTDGEKPWRQRDSEFEVEGQTKEDILAVWERGWSAAMAALADLHDADLSRSVVIRHEPLSVHAALHSSLAHTASHVGQIILLAKILRGSTWTTLSIPRGGSESFNRMMEEKYRRATKG